MMMMMMIIIISSSSSSSNIMYSEQLYFVSFNTGNKNSIICFNRINMAAISRSFRVFHKLEPPYSVMLENRNADDTLMFESNAVTVLCMCIFVVSAYNVLMKSSFDRFISSHYNKSVGGVCIHVIDPFSVLICENNFYHITF